MNIKKTFEFLFLILMTVFMTSCSQGPGVVEYNIFGQEINETNDLEELFLSETLLNEEFLKDEWLFENHNDLSQQEIVLLEKFLVEDLKIYNEVDIHIVQVDQLKDFILTDLNEKIILYNIDWYQILTKFSVGTTVIIVTGILTAIPQTSSFFASSFKGALKGALNALPQLLNASIQAFKNGGTVDKTIKYSLEKAADDYMWGTVIGAVSGSLVKINSSIIWPENLQNIGSIVTPTVDFLARNPKLFKKILYSKDIISSYITGDKAYNQDDEIVGLVHNMGWIFNELGEVIGYSSGDEKDITLDDVLIDTSNASITNHSTGQKYHIDNGKVFSGEGILVGYINHAGFIYDNINFKQSNLIGVIKDNQLLNGLQETINSGFIFDGYGRIKNPYINIGGIKYFIDDQDNIFGRLMEVIYEDKTIKVLQVKQDKSTYEIVPMIESDLYKTVGIFDSFDYIIPDWDIYFMLIRQAVIDLAWEKELEKIERTGSGTYLWTINQIQEMRETGKVKGIKTEYINTILFSSEYLFNQNNIRFISEVNYLQQFKNNSKNRVTFGSIISR